MLACWLLSGLVEVLISSWRSLNKMWLFGLSGASFWPSPDLETYQNTLHSNVSHKCSSRDFSTSALSHWRINPSGRPVVIYPPCCFQLTSISNVHQLAHECVKVCMCVLHSCVHTVAVDVFSLCPVIVSSSCSTSSSSPSLHPGDS